MAVFYLRRSSDNRFYFVAYARFGLRLVQSGPYATRDAAHHAVEACRAAAADDSRYQRREFGAHKFYFNMIDASDRDLAFSETFESAYRRDETIAYCRERLAGAGFTDESRPAARV